MTFLPRTLFVDTGDQIFVRKGSEQICFSCSVPTQCAQLAIFLHQISYLSGKWLPWSFAQLVVCVFIHTKRYLHATCCLVFRLVLPPTQQQKKAKEGGGQASRLNYNLLPIFLCGLLTFGFNRKTCNKIMAAPPLFAPLPCENV